MPCALHRFISGKFQYFDLMKGAGGLDEAKLTDLVLDSVGTILKMVVNSKTITSDDSLELAILLADGPLPDVQRTMVMQAIADKSSHGGTAQPGDGQPCKL